MSHTLTDLLRTNAELDLIAAREFGATDDLVLAGLAELARAVDEHPAPALEPARSSGGRCAEPVLPATTRPIERTRKGGFALAATVALMLSSSGLAAAVSGDPLAPFHYVARHVLGVGSHDSGQIPGWDLDGASSISIVRDGAVSMNRLGLPPGAGDGSLGDGGLSIGWHQPRDVTHRGAGHGPGGQPRPGHGHRPNGPIDRGGGSGTGSDPGQPVIPSRPTDPRHGRHGGGGTHPTSPPDRTNTQHALPTGPHATSTGVVMSGRVAVPGTAAATPVRASGPTVSQIRGAGS